LINAGNTAQYSATAWFSDGSSEAVSPFWSVNSGAATISLYGLLSANQVGSNTTVTVSANYTINSVIRTAATNITIQVVQPTVLNASIVGSQLLLTWPTNDSAFKLFYTTNLSRGAWIANPVVSSIVDGQYTITNSMTNQMEYYRLQK
jgi:hypothetical protein